MTRTDNEHELVLGNKQLLSAFFVVVALLGVFFTAGYIVGRNTGATASKEASREASANASPAPDVSPSVTPRQPIAPEPAEPVTSPTPPTMAPAHVKEPPVETSAAAEEPREAVAVQSAPGHQYLQVMAVKRPEADKMVALLKKRGLPALVGESSKPELFRVLVGPFSDTATLAKNKTALKDLGFESVISK